MRTSRATHVRTTRAPKRRILGCALAGALLAVGGLGAAPAQADPAVPDIGPGSPPGFGVRCVQAIYYSTGFSAFYPNGVYGPETAADTRRFERLLGLPQDGIVDPIVGEAMYLIMEIGSGPGSWYTIGCWSVVPSLH